MAVINIFPFNLILATAAAWVTIFIGFLPTKNLRTQFFAREAVKAGIVWLVVDIACDASIRHYVLLIALFCFFAWWQLRKDRSLGGKIWLSLASGLGISVGVMLPLAVTPQAYPPGLPKLYQSLLLGSIYLGGAVIGLAYVVSRLIQARADQSDITRGTIQRYAGVLLAVAILRGVVVLVHTYLSLNLLNQMHEIGVGPAPQLTLPFILVGLTLLALPILGFMAFHQVRGSMPSRALPILYALCGVGIGAEWLARLLKF